MEKGAAYTRVNTVFGFQPLPRVPKIFTPSVACPRCFYANDEHFRYCQNCGYARVQVQGALAGDRVRIDQEMIAGRLDELAKQRGSSSYVRQKSSLKKGIVFIFIVQVSGRVLGIGDSW